MGRWIYVDRPRFHKIGIRMVYNGVLGYAFVMDTRKRSIVGLISGCYEACDGFMLIIEIDAPFLWSYPIVPDVYWVVQYFYPAHGRGHLSNLWICVN